MKKIFATMLVILALVSCSKNTPEITGTWEATTNDTVDAVNVSLSETFTFDKADDAEAPFTNVATINIAGMRFATFTLPGTWSVDKQALELKFDMDAMTSDIDAGMLRASGVTADDIIDVIKSEISSGKLTIVEHTDSTMLLKDGAGITTSYRRI